MCFGGSQRPKPEKKAKNTCNFSTHLVIYDKQKSNGAMNAVTMGNIRKHLGLEQFYGFVHIIEYAPKQAGILRVEHKVDR